MYRKKTTAHSSRRTIHYIFFAFEVRLLSIHICQCERKAFIFGATTFCVRQCYNIFVAKHEKFRIENGKKWRRPATTTLQPRICCQPIRVKMK